ncbi:MAG TPA: glycosyltransferase family 2 protein [Chitinophagaceae bacterium]|nr:glycosyltransferase family 2 protein [Chitinophagaceae bacterium]
MGLLQDLPVPSENRKGWPWREEIQPDVYNCRNNWPTISIVVPSYNQGRYLEETLRSILLQNYPSLELIIIDGGSRDETIDIIKKYEPWITHWVSEKDKGQSEAINKGFNKVNGEIVNWLCSDDLLTLGALKTVTEIFFEASDETGLIYGATTLFGEGVKPKNSYGFANPTIERLISGQVFSQPSAFFKYKYLSKAGAWVREDLNLGMDFDLFCRLACVCQFREVKEIFSLYRLHESSKTVTMHAHLIDDWCRSFSNICKNNGWEDVAEKMKIIPQLSVLQKYQYTLPFSAAEKLHSANKDLALFYHLCLWLKSNYWYGKHNEAREILRILNANYPKEWIDNEKGISSIIFKLSLPPFLLRMLKTIKKIKS